MEARSLRTLAAVLLSALAAALAGAVPASAARPGGVLLVLDAHGHVRREWDPYLPPPQPLPAPSSALSASASARTATAKGPTVSAVLMSLEKSGAITSALETTDLSTYVAARKTLTRLTGTRASELGAVIANLRAIAATGQLTADRLAELMLTLSENRQWWSTGPLLAADARVSFPGSRLVWEYYPGQGIEIQWLGTFGQANAYWSAGENTDLQQAVAQMLSLASARAGGLTWEYDFRFDGGSPPWTSGLSQGTALQVLARAAQRLNNPALIADAHRALAIFTVPPPAGVAVTMPAGTWYAEYTYAPTDRILNGFIQSLVGLYDDAMLTGDPLAVSLFQAGDAEARAATPSYDTGAWSLYDQYGESDLSYHQLLTTFLQNLCSRVESGASVPAPSPALAGAGAPAEPPTSTTPAVGGAPATGGALAPAPEILGSASADGIYCTTAQHFTADLKTPPVLSLLTRTLTGGRSQSIRYTISKISTVTLSVRRGATLVYRSQALIGHGTRTFSWTPPTYGGSYSVTVAATDLAGNTGRARGTVLVHPAPKPKTHSRRPS
ncbi:MAG TPA: D-glucuronyl C5-epimerase family protein [Solirubrobacteraceae bacterium]|jgi:hypothetical protein|nr:D-glucuronyl C5-epimerase family protein [Solirubrobacteraceae bacterium]